MKKIFLFYFVLISSVSAFPQWRWQNPLPCGNILSSVCFTSASTGYAVGDAGTIMKTTDGGLNWTIRTGPEAHLNAICFTDENTGFAAGYGTDGSVILRTNDAGETWNKILSTTGGEVATICFPDFHTGYAIEDFGSFFKTCDGGLTWTRFSILPQLPYLNSAFFTDVNTGYVVGSAITKTIDGGFTWDTLYSDAAILFESVFFTDSVTGYAVGNRGTILKTIDAGLNWTLDTVGLGSSTMSDYFQSIFFTDANTGYAVGDFYAYDSGTIFKTINAGATWTAISTGTMSDLRSVFFPVSDTGYGVYGSGIMKTTNVGASWTSLSKGSTSPLTSVFFADSSTGYAMGYGGYPYSFLKTTNGGQNWTRLTSSLLDYITSVFFTDTQTGYATDWDGRIYKTSNGGIYWNTISSGTTHPLNSVFFTDPNTGYVVGGNPYLTTNQGIILKTTDAGATWTKTDLDYVLNSVYFTDSKTGYAAGFNPDDSRGSVVKTTDGGATWNSIPSLDNDPFTAVFFTDSLTGFVAGSYHLMKTTDGGVTWSATGGGGSWIYQSICFPTRNIGYVVDDHGGILKTTDGGDSWIHDTSGTNHRLHCVFFIDSITGWVVGEHGTILKTGHAGEPYLTVLPSERLVDSNAGTTNFLISSNTTWNVTSDSSWCNVVHSGTGNDTIFVDYSQNTATQSREDTIRIYVPQQPVILRKVTIKQEANNGIENIGLHHFRIYPNPATNKVMISETRPGRGNYTVSIYSLTGEEVMSCQYRDQNQAEIDISMLDPGVYLIKLKTDQAIDVQKLVIQ